MRNTCPTVSTPARFEYVLRKNGPNPTSRGFRSYQKKRWNGESSHRVPAGHCPVSDREEPNQHAKHSRGSKRHLSMHATTIRAWVRWVGSWRPCSLRHVLIPRKRDTTFFLFRARNTTKLRVSEGASHEAMIFSQEKKSGFAKCGQRWQGGGSLSWKPK